MSLTVVAISGIVILLLFMAIRVPIAFAMAVVGFLGIAYLSNWHAALQIVAAELWHMFSSYTLTAIPTFVLMGNLAFKSGLTERLYRTAGAWVGHFPGGIGGTTILASAGFGAICGSGIAATATMTTVAMPEMKKHNYDLGFSAGMLAVAGTLGIIIPPSLIMIIVATTVGESVTQLFIAGLIPGLFLTLTMLGLCVFMCWRNPKLGRRGTRASWSDRISSLTGVIEILLIFLLVIGGIYLGWFTPTEAGAVGAFGVFVSSAVRGQMTLAACKGALIDTARLSAMVIFLIAASVIFGKFMAVTRLPFEIIKLVQGLEASHLLVLLIIIGIFIIGGMLIDSVAFLVLALPIFFPVVVSLGYDPIWFLLIATIVTAAGAVTPPVGVHIFVVGGIQPEIPISKIFRGSNIFMTTYVLLIAIMIIYPDIFLILLR